MKIEYKKLSSFLNTLTKCGFDDITLDFNEEGLHFRGMNPGQEQWLGFKLPKEEFKGYEQGNFTTNAEWIDKILKSLKGCKMLDISFNNNITIFSGEDVQVDALSFNQEDPVKEPKLDLDVKVTLNTHEVQHIMKKLTSISLKLVRIQTKGKTISFTNADPHNVLKGESRKLDLGCEVGSASVYVTPVYLANFLTHVCKNVDKDHEFLLELRNDMPIRITTKAFHGDLKYVLAPRIELDVSF